MTDQKKIQEQMALHDYWSPTEDAVLQEDRVPKRNASRALQRVVKIPAASDPSAAWRTFEQRRQERQERQHEQTRLGGRRHSPLVPRTFAQTGVRATSGRVQAIRRPLPRRSSPIPARSGRRATRRGLFWKILGLFTLGMVVIVLSSFVLTGNVFRIAQVNVEGTSNDQLMRTIQQMGMQGQNIFLLDVTGFTERITALPQVASVDLRKQLPNHLTVHVQERLPVLLWQTGKETFGVDSHGMVIAPAADLSTPDSLSTVIDVSTRQDASKQKGQKSALALPVLRPGERLDTSDVAFAQDVMRRLPQLVGISTFKVYYDGTLYSDTTKQGEKGADSGGSFIIDSSAGWKAYLGGPADTNSLDNRLIELREILALTQQQQLDVASIDLRYGLRPTFTLKQSS